MSIEKCWTPIVRQTKRFTMSNGTPVARSQFPMYHRNATTIHKTQGLTLESAIIDLSSKKKKEAGKYYVALSRFTNSSTIEVGNYKKEEVTTNKTVQEEMERLQKN